jgi:hypothetical protein
MGVSKNIDFLGNLRRLAEDNGGKLLSTEWKGNKAKYRFAFADGREFETRAARIGQPSQGWPKDPDAYFRNYSKNRGSIHLDEMRRIAEEGGGRLLSKEWIGDTEKYRFSFADGRVFEVKIGSIRRGWPKDPDDYLRTYADGRESLLLDELLRIAEKNGGKLLSKKWNGSQVKYKFAFADGREFESLPGKIRKGWPKDPELYFRVVGEKRGEILLDDMRKIAHAHGGKLISTVWEGSRKKYRFSLSDGREFLMTSINIKFGGGWPKDPDRYLAGC